MQRLVLISSKRDKVGTNVARSLRREKRIPAIIYGFGSSYSISIMEKEFTKEYFKGNIVSKVVDIQLENKLLTVIARSVQVDPVSDAPIHADFQLVKDNVPVKLDIKVKVKNHDKSPGIKRGGIMNLVKKHMTVKGIVANLPSHIEIDISGYEIGKNIYVRDISIDSTVSVIEDKDSIVLTIAGRVEEEGEDVENSSSEEASA